MSRPTTREDSSETIAYCPLTQTKAMADGDGRKVKKLPTLKFSFIVYVLRSSNFFLRAGQSFQLPRLAAVPRTRTSLE